MKQFCFFALVFILTLSRPAQAQPTQLTLPAATLVPHYLLPIGYNTTTVLIFPATVKPVDRGDRDILAQKQSGVENVLKLKAARKNFSPTNLHVFTEDGHIYAFDIVYTDSLSSTHDLSGLLQADRSSTSPLILLSQEPVNSAQMAQYITQIAQTPKMSKRPTTRRDQMTLRVDALAQVGQMLFLRLRIANHSNLDYSLDFIRMYIRDKQKAKRTSVQEKEITPLYEDSTTHIPGDSTITHILSIPAFALPDGKQFIIEAFEKGGGRSLTLHVTNKTLFRAAKL